MKNKRQISRKYLFLYIITILFSLIYSGTFLVLTILVTFSRLWLLDFYLLPIFLGSIRILFALFPRFNFRKDKSLIYTDKSFLENTRKIAAVMGSSCPEKIYAIYDTNAYAFSYKGKEVIAIGFPLIILMDKFELSTIISHELAHHFLGDVRYGKNIKKVKMIFVRLMTALSSRWFLILTGPYRLVVNKIFREIMKISRQNEYDADLQAARLVGKQYSISAFKKIQISVNSWRSYLERWVRMLNENEVYVDIFENYSLFVNTTYIDTDKMDIKYETADEYDTHPSTYERIQAIEKKCENDRNIVELKDYSIDSVRLSRHFWGFYSGGDLDELNIKIVSSSRKALKVLAKKLIEKYEDIFAAYTYSDASTIMSIYSKVSYRLYEKTYNDIFEYEKDMIIKILSFIIFEKVKPVRWKIGPFFTPVIIIGDKEFDLYSIIDDNFNFNNASWKEMLEVLRINDGEHITHSTEVER